MNYERNGGRGGNEVQPMKLQNKTSWALAIIIIKADFFALVESCIEFRGIN